MRYVACLSSLIIAISSFPYQSLICYPSVRYSLNCVCKLQHTITFTVVVTVAKFVAIAVQMLYAGLVIHTNDTTLKDAPKALNRVCAIWPVHPFVISMVNHDVQLINVT